MQSQVRIQDSGLRFSKAKDHGNQAGWNHSGSKQTLLFLLLLLQGSGHMPSYQTPRLIWGKTQRGINVEGAVKAAVWGHMTKGGGLDILRKLGGGMRLGSSELPASLSPCHFIRLTHIALITPRDRALFNQIPSSMWN